MRLLLLRFVAIRNFSWQAWLVIVAGVIA